MKKYVLGVVLSLGILVAPTGAYASGLTSAQIQSILNLLSVFGADATTISNVTTALNGGTPSASTKSFCHTWNTDLTVGNSGDDVSALNTALASSGVDTTSNTSVFTENSAGDVVAFQAKYGIRQTGYVGPMTRAKLNALHGCYTDQKTTEWTAVLKTPVTTSSTYYGEQVKCVFGDAKTEQKCWGDAPSKISSEPIHYGCSGVGTCVSSVKGVKGTPITWGSSCGGSADTTIDGTDEYAKFNCATTSTTATATATAAAPAAIDCSLAATSYTSSPYTYVSGQVYVTPNSSVTLSWKSQNATAGVWSSGDKAGTSGSATFSNLVLGANTWSIMFSGSGGSKTCSTTVYVDQKG